MGIIGCTILQTELLYVLSRDQELGTIAVLDGPDGLAFERRARERLPTMDIRRVGWEKLEWLEGEGLSVVVDMKGTSLHRDPEAFRKEVIGTCERMRGHVGAVLVFYGLCRNALRKMDKVSREIGLPVIILHDREGNEVDDCFGALMGGRRSYLQHLREHRGTMFVIPGYAEHWAGKLGGKDVVKSLEAYNDLRFVFERCGYDKLLRIDTGLVDQAEFEAQVSTFARLFDMSLSSEAGDLSVFEHSYYLAKHMMRGSPPGWQSSDQECIGREETPF